MDENTANPMPHCRFTGHNSSGMILKYGGMMNPSQQATQAESTELDTSNIELNGLSEQRLRHFRDKGVREEHLNALTPQVELEMWKDVVEALDRLPALLEERAGSGQERIRVLELRKKEGLTRWFPDERAIRDSSRFEKRGESKGFKLLKSPAYQHFWREVEKSGLSPYLGRSWPGVCSVFVDITKQKPVEAKSVET